jgi:hypothetical protein
LSIPYLIQNQSVTFLVQDTLVYNLVDTIPFELCNDDLNPDSWSCVDGDCETDENGEYSSLSACESICQSSLDTSWNCVDGNCVALEDSTGTYATLQECNQSCGNVSNPEYHKINNNIYKITDILGRETEFKKGELLIYFFEDGRIEKRYFIE